MQPDKNPLQPNTQATPAPTPAPAPVPQAPVAPESPAEAEKAASVLHDAGIDIIEDAPRPAEEAPAPAPAPIASAAPVAPDPAQAYAPAPAPQPMAPQFQQPAPAPTPAPAAAPYVAPQRKPIVLSETGEESFEGGSMESGPAPKNDPSIKPLRTFKTDAEEAVRYQNMSVAHIAVAAQQKKEAKKAPAPTRAPAPTPIEATPMQYGTKLSAPTPRSSYSAPMGGFGNSFVQPAAPVAPAEPAAPAPQPEIPDMVGMGIDAPPKKSILPLLLVILLFLAVGGGGYYYWFYVHVPGSPSETGTSTQPAAPSQPRKTVSVKTIIPYSQAETLAIDPGRDALSALSAKLASVSGRQGDVYAVIPVSVGTTTTVYPIAPIFANTHIPDILKRSLSNDYMAGSYITDKNNPFLIMRTTFFQNAFAGMLDWEGDMRNDLISFIHVAYPSEAPVSVAGDKFSDVVTSNIDTRVLKNAGGQTILAYAFADKDTIVLAADTSTLKALLDKLLTVRVVQ